MLVILYTSVAVGINVAVHYCGNKFSSFTFGTKDKGCCCKKAKKAHKCCNTKVFTVKVKDNHQPANAPEKAKPGVNVLLHQVGITPTLFSKGSNHTVVYNTRHGPPPLPQPLFLINLSILI